MPRHSIAQRAASGISQPNDNDRRGDRPLQNPQWDATFGRRRQPVTAKDIPRLRNGARLKDIVSRLKAHRSANPSDFLKCRAAYLIAAACHCPDSHDLEDWLPRWAAHHLHLPSVPGLAAKLAVAIACKPGRLSAEEVADLLPTTFDDREWLKLWTFGACDMTPQQRRKRSKKERQRKERQRSTDKRRAAGAKPRSKSLSQTQPWVPLGISRRTWERRRKKLSQISG